MPDRPFRYSRSDVDWYVEDDQTKYRCPSLIRVISSAQRVRMPSFRHPTYLAINLLGLGSAIWVSTPVVMLAAALLVVAGDLRARTEERALLEAFGERYRNYMQRVPRIVPGLY